MPMCSDVLPKQIVVELRPATDCGQTAAPELLVPARLPASAAARRQSLGAPEDEWLQLTPAG